MVTINKIITIRKGIFLILEARQKDNLLNKHEFTKLSTDYKGDASLPTQCPEQTFNVGIICSIYKYTMSVTKYIETIKVMI